MTIIFQTRAEAEDCLIALLKRWRPAHMRVHGNEFHVVTCD